MIREQIDTEHNTNTQNIRASYHDRQEITHEEYHSQLNAENERYEAELIAKGYLVLPSRDLAAEIDELRAKVGQLEGIAIIRKS